ncbi:DUF4878 domain-containing protein [Dechloromonas hortensis]|uniref:DUF4878 domain-containing protein n=1 Tax=Dechloromonas hortensis TaxID=337779 RepID=UPI001291AB7E|nr:DUF4878 domain-containing protein [Dechloromonas hortensis]
MRYLFVVFLFALSACSDGPDVAAKRLLDNLKAGKHLAVEESLSKDMHSFAMLMGGVNNANLQPYYRTGAIADFKLVERERAERSVRYVATITTTAGKQQDDLVTVVKEDGQWKIGKF